MDKIKMYVNKLIEILSLKELSILPSYLAYSLVLAIIPIITIIVLVVGIFDVSIQTVITFIDGVLPSTVSGVISSAINGKSFDFSLGVLNFTTFIVAANGMYAIINASNSLYKIDSNSKIKDRLRSFIILLIMILLLLFMIIVPLLGDKIINIASNFIVSNTILDMIELIYHSLKWPVTLLLVFFAIKAIYVIAPSIKVRGEDTTLGAFIVTIGWTLFTALFGYYINLFGKYDIIYGGLSSIIILLIWFYVMSYILIFGIVINSRKYNK